MGARPVPFPTLRWVAVAWIAVWAPSYAAVWGWRNFLQLCDVAVFLTAIGLWRGSALVLSTQAVSSLVVDALWTIDVAGRLVTGRHLIGGTAYMWDDGKPLGVRALSLFHVALPVLLSVCLKRVGYDRRALPVQAALATVVLGLSRMVGDAAANPNFAFRDPFYARQWGPPVVHVAFMLAVLVVAVYVPTHLLLGRVWPRPTRPEGRCGAATPP